MPSTGRRFSADDIGANSGSDITADSGDAPSAAFAAASVPPGLSMLSGLAGSSVPAGPSTPSKPSVSSVSAVPTAPSAPSAPTVTSSPSAFAEASSTSPELFMLSVPEIAFSVTPELTVPTV